MVREIGPDADLAILADNSPQPGVFHCPADRTVGIKPRASASAVLGQFAPKVIFTSLVHIDPDDISGAEPFMTFIDEKIAIDFGCVGFRPAGRGIRVDLVDDHLDPLPDLGGKLAL